MTAYYNEIDPYCVQWLKNLIAEGLIADGHVDDRSIQDVTPNDLLGYTQCHFFAGLGGWPAALRRSGVWPDHRPVWTGSCPCQPFSLAGKQGGFADERHLWPQWRYLIAQCRPATILGEQVASASQWLKLVRGDLEILDYAVGAMPVEAASAGAFHLRDRYWFVADDGRRRRDGSGWRQGQFEGRAQTERPSAVGHSSSTRLAVGSLAEDQRRDVRLERTTVSEAGDRGGLANTYEPCAGEARQQRSREQCGARGDQEARVGGDDDLVMADPASTGSFPAAHARIHRGEESAGARNVEPERLAWVLGADGKARVVKSLVCCLVNGIWCGLDGVRAGLAYQAAEEVIRHAQKSARSPEEVLYMVRNVFIQETLQRAVGVRGELPEAEILLAFLLDVASACDQPADRRRFTQAHGFNSEGALRSVRVEDIDLGSPCQRRPDGQFDSKFTDPVLSLSWILAWHAEAYRRIAQQAYAKTLPLLCTGEVNRVQKLRALGNAIDLRPATAFIQAASESIA